jgi:hypothetical protein
VLNPFERDLEDGQGRRSRGDHMWAPCLEGPDTHGDTMVEAGRNRPAWMRSSPRRKEWTDSGAHHPTGHDDCDGLFHVHEMSVRHSLGADFANLVFLEPAAFGLSQNERLSWT